MTVSIGRRGWTGISLQASKDIPVGVAEYIPWETNTLAQMTAQMAVNNAHGIRDSNFSSVPGQQHSEGEFKDLMDPRFVGYFLAGALGTVNTTSLGGGVQSHAFTENQSDQPLFLNVINNRVVDQEYYPNIAVSSLDLEVGTDLATMDAKVIGDIAFTTTSGNFTTTSGNIWSFKNVQFGIGSTIANAAANLYKTTSIKLTIDNSTEALFAHGSVRPYQIAHKDLKVSADIELYFENTADKLAFYNQTKQAAILKFVGNPLPGGFSELLTINLFQITFKSFAIDTGLDNFQVEKITISGEYSVPDSATISAVLVNGDSNY